MSPVVVVQEVLTYWTKASRGGAEATRRNAVPEAVTLPLSHITTVGLTGLLHKVAYRETDDFVRKDEPLQLDPPVTKLVVGCVTVNLARNTVFASFRYDYWKCGFPEREWTRKTL